MRSPSRRLSQLLTFFTLVSLCASLLPISPRTVAAAPQRSVQAAPLLSLPSIPTPATAASTGLPSTAIDQLRARFGNRHTRSGLFDGTFRTPGVQTDALGGATQQANNSIIGYQYINTYVIPAGIPRDSLRFDITLTNDGIYGSGAGISIRAAGSTTWGSEETIFDGPQAPSNGTPVTKTGTNLQVTLGNAVPASSAMEIRLRCWTDNRSNNTCTWSNLRIFQDVAGWQARLSKPSDWFTYEVTDGGLDGIGPNGDRGAFLGIRLREAGSGGRYSSSSVLRGPSVTLPPLSSSDVLTASMAWSRVFDDPTPFGDSGGVTVRFTPEDNSGAVVLVSVPSTSALTPTPWTRVTGSQLNATSLARISGKRGWFEIVKPLGGSNHTIALDDVILTLNGQPLVEVPFFADQFNGKCPCDLGGSMQIIFGDPVNTFSGSFSYQASDIALAAEGPTLSFGRTYTSLFANPAQYPSTTFGTGWRHSFEHRLTPAGQPGGSPGVVIYEVPSGNRLRFTDIVGDGTLPALPGIHATLVRAADRYTLTQRDQSQLVFDAQGRLISQRDPQGHQQSLQYYAEPDAIRDGQLAQVTDDVTGRGLTLDYVAINGAPRLTRVGDTAGRSISYTYTADGDLATVQDLRGGTTTYTYVSGSHLLASIIDPVQVTQVSNTYDSQQRVSQQLDATGTRTTYSYAATAVGSATTITIEKPGGQPDVLVHHYRLDGSLEYQERNGQITQYVAYDSSAAPSVIVNGNGAGVDVRNNLVGLPLRVTDATNLTSAIQYRSDHRPSQVTTPDGIVVTATYDAAGNLSSVQQTGGTLRLTDTYAYTGDNRLAEVRSADGVVSRHEYDVAGQRIRTTFGFGTTQAQVVEYGYDSLGRLTTTTIGVGTTLVRTDRTVYNDDDTIRQTILNDKDGGYDPNKPDEDLVTDYGYDLLGRLIWTRTPDNRYDATGYDTQGRVIWTVQNLTGYTGGTLPATPPAYTPSLPDANIATFYSYDDLGRLSLVTETGILDGVLDPQTLRFSSSTSRITRTEYDSQSRPVTVTLNYRPDLPATADTNVQLITYYDGAGNSAWQRDGLGRWMRTEYDAASRPITVTANFENGNPLTVEASNQSWTDGSDSDLITVTRYDTVGRVSRVIDNYVDGTFTTTEPITDRVTLYGYDTLSRVTSTTQNAIAGVSGTALNRRTEARFDATTGRLIGTKDPLNRWDSFQYDVLGRVSGTTQNCQSTTAPVSCNAYIATARDRNIATRTFYDELGRIASTVQNYVDGTFTATKPDEDITTRTVYDGAGRPTSNVQNAVDGAPANAQTNVTTQARYDALGRVVEAIDAAQARSYATYDGLGRVITTRDANNRDVQRGYDGTGTLRWTRRADGQITLFAVDGLGRTQQTVVNYVPAGTGTDQNLTATVTYDVGGRQQSTTDPAGRVTQFAYNLRDELVGVTENVLSSCALEQTDCNTVTQYRYDRVGNRTVIIDANGQVRRFAYNAANEQTSATDGIGRVTGWLYDAFGRVTRLDDPRGDPFDLIFQYDGRDRRTSIAAGNSANLTTITMAYDALGRRTGLVDGSGTTSFQYDPLGRTVQVQAPKTGLVAYTYSPRGQRTALQYPGGATANYTYYPDGQLATVASGATTLATYTYDSVGRLDSAQRANGATTAYRYDGADRLLDLETTANGTTVSRFQYQVDRLGLRLAADETIGTAIRNVQYTYDGLLRLTGATEQGSTTSSTAYQYDKVGNRVEGGTSYDAAYQRSGWQYDAAGNVLSDGTTNFRYDALNRVTLTATSGISTTHIYNGDGVLVQSGTATYTQDLGVPLPQILQTGGANYFYGHERLAAQVSGTTTWYGTDALGSVRQTLDNVGAPLASVNYDSWGLPQGNVISPFGFTGELQNAAGLTYLRARWYAPNAGSFVSLDPYEGYPTQPYSLHPYTYSHSNPVNWTDPSGKCLGWMWGDPSCQFAGTDYTRYDYAGAGQVVVTGLGVAGTIVACAGTAGVACAAGAAGAAGVASWGNQALNNAGMPVDQAMSNIRWSEVAREAGISAVTGPLGGLAGRGVVSICYTGNWCSAAIGAAMGTTSSGSGQILRNLLDMDPQTSLLDGLLEACAFGGITGGLVGRFLIRLPKLGEYGELRGTFPRNSNMQAHHLNQNAAFKSIIPEDEAVAVGLRGNAFSEPATPHYRFHTRMEQFWDQFRRGGARFGQIPSNAEYSKAVYESSRYSRLPDIYARALQAAAKADRLKYGLQEADPVPRVPRRIPQQR